MRRDPRGGAGWGVVVTMCSAVAVAVGLVAAAIAPPKVTLPTEIVLAAANPGLQAAPSAGLTDRPNAPIGGSSPTGATTPSGTAPTPQPGLSSTDAPQAVTQPRPTRSYATPPPVTPLPAQPTPSPINPSPINPSTPAPQPTQETEPSASTQPSAPSAVQPTPQPTQTPGTVITPQRPVISESDDDPSHDTSEHEKRVRETPSVSPSVSPSHRD